MSRISRTAAAIAGALLVPFLGAPMPTAGSAEASFRATDDRMAGCSRNVHGWFKPTRAEVAGIGTTIRVYAVARKADGSMGAPPLTDAGKRAFGWDKLSTPPGYHKGSVPIDAHTYPDGSALGNALMRQLQVGERVVLKGADGQRLCYKIDSKRAYLVADVPQRKIFRTEGSPQIAIIVCSGKRLGPGNWTKRTIWFGHPIP